MKLKGERMLAERTAMLEGLVSGKIQPEETTNAALWYLRGIERLATLEAAQLALLRGAADSDAPTISDELGLILESSAVRDMTELFEKAAQMRRCDFRAATKREPTTFISTYVGGMNDAVRALRLQAIRQMGRMSENGQTQALGNVTLSLRVIGHLGNDQARSSALTSSEAASLSLTRSDMVAGRAIIRALRRVFDDSHVRVAAPISIEAAAILRRPAGAR
jgi:hypothetical protein